MTKRIVKVRIKWPVQDFGVRIEVGSVCNAVLWPTESELPWQVQHPTNPAIWMAASWRDLEVLV